MKNDAMSPLAKSVAGLLEGSTEAKPVHWTVFVSTFVESGKYTNAQLVKAMNSLLVPQGKIRGMNHNFWIEPLPKAIK